ncbi:MAG: hypothetical protein DRP74_03005 [Candidatus Omnitrophota bacterium]|nr:MAG: hypothetical protein DRP74_03005 [Candidatus Omnitrophota bacterium]
MGIGSEGVIGYNLRLDAGKNHLGLDYASLEAEGANTLSRDIEFNGQTYSASTHVESKLKCELLEIQYYYDIITLQWENWGIDLASLFKVNIYEAEVSIKGGGYDETYSETLPLPTVGIAGQLNATRYFSVLGQVNGIGYSDDTYLEYKALLRIKPAPFFNFDLGYKGIQLNYSDSNNLLDLDVEGFLMQGAFIFKF